jgi:hypothetical protein
MSHQNHNYLGDKSQFENRGMDEQEFLLYRCPVCRYEEDIAVLFEPSMNQYVFIDGLDAICPECHEMFMEKA